MFVELLLQFDKKKQNFRLIISNVKLDKCMENECPIKIDKYNRKSDYFPWRFGVSKFYKFYCVLCFNYFLTA